MLLLAFIASSLRVTGEGLVIRDSGGPSLLSLIFFNVFAAPKGNHPFYALFS